MPRIDLTDSELEHLTRWRSYQQWIAALPPGLNTAPKAFRNPCCSALGTAKTATCTHALKSTRKA